jgi:tetratricopeptide (TPR) repeat protein
MSGNEKSFQQAMNKGHSAAWEQAWEQAAGFYKQALEEFPDNLPALNSLGLAQYELQDFEGALHSYAKAAKGAPDDPVPFEKISQIYERSGNKERARAALLQAAELHLKNRDVTKAIESWGHVTMLQPENLTAHSRLALVYERLGKTDEAVSEYLCLAALFQRGNDQEKALRAAQHALDLKPGNSQAVNALATLRDFKPLALLPGKPRDTAPLRQPAVRQLQAPHPTLVRAQLDPMAEANQKALSAIAGMLFEVPEDERAARRGFNSIVRGTGSLRTRPVDFTRIVLHLGQVVEMQTQGDTSQAAIELEHAVEAGLDNAAAYYDLGNLHFHNNELEDATRNLQIAVQHPDFALAARLLLGQIYKKKGQMRQAAVEYLGALRQADIITVSPEQADILDQLYEPLVEAQSLDNDPQRQQQVCENVSALLVRSDWREHMRQARQQLPLQSDDGPPMPLAEILTQARSSQIVESLSTIHQLERAGHLRSAMEEAFFALQLAPSYLHLHITIGDLLIKQGQTEEAMEKFLVVAQSYSSRGEARRAISLYRKVVELAPLDLNARMRLIEMLTSMGQNEEALTEHMEFAEVHYSMANLEQARKSYEEALSLAQQSKVDRSWQSRILHRMADIDMQSLDWRHALRTYEQIRTLVPDDEDARSSLVTLNFRYGQEARGLAELDNYLDYLEGSGKRDKAIQFLEGLLTEDPKRVGLLRRLAERYYTAGRVDDAVVRLDSAGEALMDAGDVKGAIQVIETILAMRPKNVTEYKTLLAQLRGQA